MIKPLCRYFRWVPTDTAPQQAEVSDTAAPVTVGERLESPAMLLFYSSEKQAAEYLVLFNHELSKGGLGQLMGL